MIMAIPNLNKFRDDLTRAIDYNYCGIYKDVE